MSIGLPSTRYSEAIVRSIGPDLKTIPERRARVEIKAEGKDLMLKFCAQDVTALKSSINSTLRTISAMIDMLERLEQSETT